MARNVRLQVLRGTGASMPVLADGEFYFATDSGRLFVGLGGINYKVGTGMASVQIQDAAGNNLTSSAGALDVNLKSSSDATPVPVSGTVAISGTVPTTQVGGASGLTGDTQAKGVQGTVALMVQDFKDAGRVIKVFTGQFTASTTEGLVSLTPVSDGAAGTAGTSFTVTAGKRLRLQALLLTCFNVTAAIHAAQVNLRMSASGAVTTSSPIIATVGASTAAATIDLAASQAQSIPDGVELSGTMQFGVSQIGIALAGQTVVVIAYEY